MESTTVEPRKGARVKVVKGRKVPVGTTGEVIWYGDTQYGRRIGLVPDDKALAPEGKPLWTAETNVIVITPAPDDAPPASLYNPARLHVPAHAPASTGAVDPYAKKPKVTAKSITLVDDTYEISFPFDRDLVEEVKKLPRRRWDPTLQAWLVPKGLRMEVEKFASDHGFSIYMPDAAAQALIDIAQTNVKIDVPTAKNPLTVEMTLEDLEKLRKALGAVDNTTPFQPEVEGKWHTVHPTADIAIIREPKDEKKYITLPDGTKVRVMQEFDIG